MTALLAWRNYKYFPYERRFAVEEVRALLGCDVVEEDRAGLRVPADAISVDAARRLTYFSRVVLPDGTSVVPDQAQLEATAAANRRHRQSTRYSAHGLHEYKGKFNPQVVRAIGNRLGLREHSRVLDPFSGSGTTLLESAHAGWNAIGVDRNPLAVMIANAKVRAFQLADGRLSRSTREIRSAVEPWTPKLERSVPSSADVSSMLGENWRDELPALDYLDAWFPEPVLAQVALVRRVLAEKVPSRSDRAIFEVVLSNQLRDCSLQEPADLRIRRRKTPAPNYPLLSMAIGALSELVERVERAREVVPILGGEQQAVLGDVRSGLLGLPGVEEASFDAVICSPPYATALPYIDTQRLSLVVFGLIEPSEIRTTEAALVGARDIGLTERAELEARLKDDPAQGVPKCVVDLCRAMLEAAKKPGNGFRRRNTPALVHRYFRDMAAFFSSILRALRPGATAALVVGANRTTLGGEEFRINTPGLLAATATECGFANASCEPMETYQRFDLHQKNSINDEMLVLARRAAPAVSASGEGDTRELREVVVGDEAVALALVPYEGDGQLVQSRERRGGLRNDSQLELRF